MRLPQDEQRQTEGQQGGNEERQRDVLQLGEGAVEQRGERNGQQPQHSGVEFNGTFSNVANEDLSDVVTMMIIARILSAMGEKTI
jgi:hypothetical protein